MSDTALIVGATSGIGTAFAHRLAGEGLDLVLAGRDRDELQRRAADLRIRYDIRVDIEVFEARAFESHSDFVSRCEALSGEGLAGVALFHGEMPDPAPLAADPEAARRTIDINFSAAVSLLERLTPGFEARGRGWLCVVTSVAGDRGRPSNYLYGSTKAALSTYLEGLRARLGRSGTRVVDVRPGFVDTGLTWGLPGLFLVAAPQRVARDAWRGIERNRPVVYTPWFWRWIMMGIRWIPDRIFGRLDL